MNSPTFPISLDAGPCYQALCSRDARFDGRFFVGVGSTGIYCRPVCRVKTPKPGNCTFYGSAAAAEAAGFRPCLRCRPELAPGLSPLAAVSRTAGLAAQSIDENGLADSNLAALAMGLGVSSRHLRRVFHATYGVTPLDYLITRRLLTAKHLLTDTALPITEVALSAGFGSLRRFNAVFLERYAMSPSRFRRTDAPGSAADKITVLLGYRPPLGWQPLLDFLGSRAIPGVEAVEGGCFRRVISLWAGNKPITGWIEVHDRPGQNTLALSVSTELTPVLPRIIAGVRHLFDLNCVPELIRQGLSRAASVLPGINMDGLRLPGAVDGFEMAVRAILGQQISVGAARTLAGRLAEAFGRRIATPHADLRRTFPGWRCIADLPMPIEDRLGPLGITGARARCIRALAEALADNRLSLSRGEDPEFVRQRLMALPGIGPWTAEYITMRALSWPDSFPHTDAGVKKALSGRSEKEILALGEGCRPWRAYLTMMLWRTPHGGIFSDSNHQEDD
jgi:AraC family transcriptional regulator of adaptative response / DNA-3-methyladenine glycosylase II